MILVVTSGRADWGKLQPIVNLLDGPDGIETMILTVGGHHLATQGRTFGNVVTSTTSPIRWARTHVPGCPAASYGRAMEAVETLIRHERPRIVVVHGDRLEASAAAAAAWSEGIPLVQVEAGERSGVRDDGWSRQVTTTAGLVLCANENAVAEIALLTEGVAALVGCPGYDQIRGVVKESHTTTGKILVLIHPEDGDQGVLSRTILRAVRRVEKATRGRFRAWGWWPNHDEGCDWIAANIRNEVGPDCLERWQKDISRLEFLRLLAGSPLIIGNSSAGIREAGCFRTWALDVGTRQAGRLPEGPHLIRADLDMDDERLAALALDMLESKPPDRWWGFGRSDGDNALRATAAIAAFHETR